MIECRDLHMLVILSETHNLTETARRLHVTQSALSHQIKKLESYYGVRFFQRKTRPLRFTPAGQALLNLAREVLPKVQQAEQRLREYADGKLGRLYLAVECHNCFDWLLPSLDTYRQQYPSIDVDLSLSVSFEALSALQHGDVDMVITSDPRQVTGIHYHALFEYQLGLVVAKSHVLAQKAFVQPQDLSTETLLIYPVARARLDIFKYFLQPAQIEPAQVRTVELTQMMLHLIANGKGVAALPHWVVANQDAVQICALGEQGLRRTLYAAFPTSLLELDYVQSFLHLLQQQFKQITVKNKILSS